MSKNIFIKTPFVYAADDYHDFDSLVDIIYRITGKKIKFKELNTAEYVLHYYAVFYLGRYTDARRKLKLEIDELCWAVEGDVGCPF
jgi:hypothetical protein